MTPDHIEKYLLEIVETIFSIDGARDNQPFTGRHLSKEKTLD